MVNVCVNYRLSLCSGQPWALKMKLFYCVNCLLYLVTKLYSLSYIRDNKTFITDFIL